MIIVAAKDIACPVCKAAPGEKCTYIPHPRYRGQLMRHGGHVARVWDAEAATRMANVLLDG